MVYGGRETVDYILEDPVVKSVSFVGSNRAGEYIYNKGSQNGKRVQSNLGAKNPCVIMPDANMDDVVNALVGAAFGASGQRCMALSVAIFVGKSQQWIDEVAERASKLKVGPGDDPETALGPLISPAAKDRVISLIESAKKEGAKVRLDGSKFVHSTHPQGNFVGPTLISGVTFL
jgi:malonate-semialdehyde dehydrogenase (acetylating) / methylmalonate-semialdehyde dehydrogenase